MIAVKLVRAIVVMTVPYFGLGKCLPSPWTLKRAEKNILVKRYADEERYCINTTVYLWRVGGQIVSQNEKSIDLTSTAILRLRFA